MPKVDGLEVLRKIKSDVKLRNIPVVILTTSHARNDVAQAYRENANSYLVKPTNPAKFKQLMTDLGFFWLSWNYWPFLEDMISCPHNLPSTMDDSKDARMG